MNDDLELPAEEQTADLASTVADDAAEPAEIPPANDQTAAAHALRERLVSQGIALDEGLSLADVPAPVLAALLEALPSPPGPRPSDSELRGELADRIARSHRLPRGMRERLAGMVETIRFDDTGREEPALRVSDAVALLEESLPAQVLLAADDASAAEHPRGDGFFTGDPRQLSDDDARRIAAAQLARAGFLRKS